MMQARSSKIWLLVGVLLTGCGSKLKKESAEQLDFKNDFDQVVEIRSIEPPAPAVAEPVKPTKKEKKSKRKSPPVVQKAAPKPSAPAGRQPPVEDSEDMVGRRPSVDPFVVGEKVVYDMSYFAISAGELSIEILPFKEVNKKKSYHFHFEAKSNPTFSVFYSVEDSAETFLEFDDMIPSTYAIHVRESKQMREVRAFWDFKENRAKVWDKRVTKEKGVEENREEWGLEAYAQNVFSAPFYMRAFKLYPGKRLSFWVADGGENYLFKGEVLRREKLSTPVGELDTIVLKPTFELKGVFRPVGDILIWMTDDDRKTIVRIESKIKIGKVVGMLKEWHRPPR